MFQNIIFPSFKGEQPRPNYYLFPDNIYGLVISDASNNIRSVYTWTEFEVKKGMNNIASCLLCCLSYKGYYSQSYGNKNKMPEIYIHISNYGG